MTASSMPTPLSRVEIDEPRTPLHGSVGAVTGNDPVREVARITLDDGKIVEVGWRFLKPIPPTAVEEVELRPTRAVETIHEGTVPHALLVELLGSEIAARGLEDLELADSIVSEGVIRSAQLHASKRSETSAAHLRAWTAISNAVHAAVKIARKDNSK